MQIHNLLSPAQRARANDALDAVVTNLPKCRPAPAPSPDQLLFTLENGEAGVETLHVRLRDYEMRVYVAIRLGERVWRTSFVEHLREDHSANPRTIAQAGPRLSEWRRYVDDVPSDDALRIMKEKRSIAVEAAVGAATLLDARWKTLGIRPAFDTKPPFLSLGEQSGRTSFFRNLEAEGGSFGTMSNELVRALSIMSDCLFVTTSKPTSNTGIQIDFGPLPSIPIINDLSPMDLMHAIRHAGSLGLSLHR